MYECKIVGDKEIMVLYIGSLETALAWDQIIHDLQGLINTISKQNHRTHIYVMCLLSRGAHYTEARHTILGFNYALKHAVLKSRDRVKVVRYIVLQEDFLMEGVPIQGTVCGFSGTR